MKIVRQNVGLILMYLGIFFGITMMFQALAGEDEFQNYEAKRVKIGFVDEDGGALAQGLKTYLSEIHDVKEMENDRAFMQEELFYRNIEYIVHVPEGFFEACVKEGEKLAVTKIPGSYTSFYVDQQIDSFLNNAAVYYAAGFSEEEAANAAADVKSARVELSDSSGNAGNTPAYAYYFRYIPYLFLAVLCYVMGYMLSAFRKGDLPKRMQASAVPARRQNAEGLLAVGTVGTALWVIVTAAALLIYGKEFLSSGGTVYYLINSFLMLLVGMSMAYLVGMFTKDTNTLSGAVNVISLGMCFLCGVFVPLEYMNKGVKTAAQFLPVYWYEKVNDTLVEYGTVAGAVQSEILKAFGIQLMFAAVFLCITFSISKWKRSV